MIGVRYIVLFVLLMLTVCELNAQESLQEKHLEVSLRTIGHRVLLNAGDSTSRVLPIEKDSNQYIVRFESELMLNPDELINTINEVMTETKAVDAYFVEVRQCVSNEVVYSYEMGSLIGMDMLPCKSRSLPKSCYQIVFTFFGTEDLSLQKQSAPKTNKTAIYLLIGVVLSLIIVVFFLIQRTKRKSEGDPNWIQLGKYQFNRKKSELVLKEERIELTGKETDLLFLLYEHINGTVKREVILNKVWGDDGDYVGRTLDVFISKLRKKLEADPDIRIANIRGVGYKLVIN